MKKLVPNQEQVRLAELLVTAMAAESLVRPVVEAYEQAILNRHQFRIARKWVNMGCEDVIILDRKKSYLLDDEDSKVFHAECFAARDAAKLRVSHPEYCPLCEAEHLRIQAENALLKSLATIPGLEAFGRGCLTVEQRQKAVELTLVLLTPYLRRGDEILQEIVAG